MSSLVLELQHDALQPNVRVSDLLRKALVVARKLGLGEFEEWVNAELNGYKDRGTIPDYRELKGILVADDPYSGWYRVRENLKPDLAEKLTKFRIGNPISELGAWLDDKGDSIIVPHSGTAKSVLMKALYKALTIVN